MGSITINPYEEGPKKSLNKDIKTQDKEIEITSNGTTEVTPDAGFAYLNKVSVKTNVPQSGEGGGDNIEYLDISGMESGMLKEYVVAMSSLIKDSVGIVPPATAAAESSSGYKDVWNSVNEVCFNTSLKFNVQGQIMSAFDFLSLLGIDMESLPRLTEEEFYTL